MKHVSKIFVIMVCVASMSVAFANPLSRADNENHSTPIERVTENNPTPYRPPLRQGGVLFVEDPGNDGFGPLTKPDPVWIGLLDNILGAGNYGWYGHTTLPEEDGAPLDTMLNYELVIWNVYDYWWDAPNAALTTNDQNNIGTYMDNGGKVWLIGQDAIWSGVPMGWLTVYFHLASANQDYAYPADQMNVQGLAEITGFACLNVPDYQSNPFYPDELIPDGTAHGVLEDTDSSKVVGIFYPGAGDWTSAFWAVDLRTCSPPDQQEAMVYGMLDAFGVLGIHERPPQDPARRISLSIAPDPIVKHATISYGVPIADNVKLQIYNKAGQSIITLVDEYKYAGSYTVTWNARDTKGANVPNGVYFIRLTCGTMACSENIVVVK